MIRGMPVYGKNGTAGLPPGGMRTEPKLVIDLKKRDPSKRITNCNIMVKMYFVLVKTIIWHLPEKAP